MEIINRVVGFVVALILITTVAITQVYNTSTTNWTTADKAVFGIVSLVLVAGLVGLAGSFYQ